MSIVWKSILIFLGAMCGGFLSLLIFSLVAGDPVEHALKSSYGILFLNENTPINREETSLLFDLTSKGSILTPSSLMTEISSFYERVITILTGIIAILGIVAYMYIRSVSEESAARLVEEKIDKILSSGEHKLTVREIVASETEDKKQELQQMQDDLSALYDRVAETQENEGLTSSIDDLYAKVSELERAVGDKDTIEAAGHDLTLTGEDQDGSN